MMKPAERSCRAMLHASIHPTWMPQAALDDGVVRAPAKYGREHARSFSGCAQHTVASLAQKVAGRNACKENALRPARLTTSAKGLALGKDELRSATDARVSLHAAVDDADDREDDGE